MALDFSEQLCSKNPSTPDPSSDLSQPWNPHSLLPLTLEKSASWHWSEPMLIPWPNRITPKNNSTNFFSSWRNSSWQTKSLPHLPKSTLLISFPSRPPQLDNNPLLQHYPMSMMETTPKDRLSPLPARCTYIYAWIPFQRNKSRLPGLCHTWSLDEQLNGLNESSSGRKETEDIPSSLIGRNSIRSSEKTSAWLTPMLWPLINWSLLVITRSPDLLTITWTNLWS